MVWITLLLSIISVYQLWLLRDANETARDAVTVASETARQQLSAYVSPTKAELLGLNGSRPLTFRVTVKNSGQTPAFGVITSVNTWWEAAPQIAGAPPTEEGAEVFLAAGGDIAIDHRIAEQRRGGRAILNATGSVSYEDVFGKLHEVTFHFVQGGEFDPRAPEMTLVDCKYSRLPPVPK